jgi:hypothetical protein
LKSLWYWVPLFKIFLFQKIVHWKLLNVIMVNVIIQLIWSKWQSHNSLITFMVCVSAFAYCYRSVYVSPKVITFIYAHCISDKIDLIQGYRDSKYWKT